MKIVFALMLSVLLLPAIVALPGVDAHHATLQSSIIAYADDDDGDDEHEHHYGEHKEGDDAPYEEAFKLIGKLAIVLGALSLSWYLMKRKRVSKIMPVRKTANVFYRLHTYAGWSALVLVVAHGVYFFVYEWLDGDTISGLFAFVTFVALAVYGVLLSRRRLPKNRRIHFVLALVWVVLTIIHAGDAIPLLIVVVGASYGLIWFLERRLKTS
jgi:hypothetical protein